MTSRISLSLFSFLLLLFSANACTCPPVSINSAYFNAGTKRFVKAKLALSYPIGDKQAYTLRIEREYKACGKVPKYVGVLTSLTASLCGVTLKGQTSYIIALKSLNNANISLCDVSFSHYTPRLMSL